MILAPKALRQARKLPYFLLPFGKALEQADHCRLHNLAGCGQLLIRDAYTKRNCFVESDLWLS
jgi:hypothetical protein